MHRPAFSLIAYSEVRKMSSINGCINFHDTKSVSRERVQEGGRLLSHRGPDSFGMHRADGVCFYHNRLAVRDPVGGKQPMSAVFHGRRYTIVYNGEIYNLAYRRR